MTDTYAFTNEGDKVDLARVEKLEQLLAELIKWQKDPSNISYQPVSKLIKELTVSKDDEDD